MINNVHDLTDTCDRREVGGDATALPKRGQSADRSLHAYVVARGIEGIAVRRDDATEQFLFALRHLRQLAPYPLQPLPLLDRKSVV